jgi:hypothetical protein
MVVPAEARFGGETVFALKEIHPKRKKTHRERRLTALSRSATSRSLASLPP